MGVYDLGIPTTDTDLDTSDIDSGNNNDHNDDLENSATIMILIQKTNEQEIDEDSEIMNSRLVVMMDIHYSIPLDRNNFKTCGYVILFFLSSQAS